MARKSPLQKWLDQTRSSWLVLAQAAAWVLTVVGGFLLPPPAAASPAASNVWVRFGQFLVAVMIGLIFFGVLKWHQRKHAQGWWMTAVGCVLAATALFFTYQHLTASWTGDYAGQPIIVGTELTPHARAFVAQHPNLPLDELLQNFIGRAEDIWTRETIHQRRLTLAGVYVICLPLFTLVLISVIQAIRCLTPAPAPKKRR